jgi:aquaporin Z
MNSSAIIVEFIGTFLFLFVIVLTGNPVVIGGALAFLIYLALNISGGHFNPAVTLMTLFNNGIALDNASGYIIAQITAGILAVSAYNYMKKSKIV